MPMTLGPVSAARRARALWALAFLTAGVGSAAAWHAGRATAPQAQTIVMVPTVVSLPVPTGPDPNDAIESPIKGVAVSPHDRRLQVAWTAQHVFLSRDDGVDFRSVLDGFGAVNDAAFDEHGRLYVLRGEGWLGVFEEYAEPDVTWTYVGRFDDGTFEFATASRPRLAIDGDTVAVIGADPADPTQLRMARRDRLGRWQVAPLFKDRSYEYWDAAEVWAVDPAGNGRVRVIVETWESDMCGHEAYHELVVDLRRGTARTRVLGYESPER